MSYQSQPCGLKMLMILVTKSWVPVIFTVLFFRRNKTVLLIANLAISAANISSGHKTLGNIGF